MSLLNISLPVTRRTWLRTTACGFGYVALAGLAAEAAARESGHAASLNPLAPRAPHFPARAKRVIFLYMQGGPSHVDTFDYKPRLTRDAGKSASELGLAVPARKGDGTILPSPFQFRQHGQSGLWISELFPHLARHADDVCLLNGMHTDVPNHPQSCLMLHTGEFRFTRPSLGAWVLYGLGTENQDLPGFITISPPANLGGAQNYGNAFLAASYQATRIGEQDMPVANARVGNIAPRLSREQERQQIDLIQAMNRELLQRQPGNPELDGVINSFELGYRMQASLPQLMDLTREPKKILEMYGIGQGGGRGGKKGGGGTDNFGRQCLMARRFVEAGVRYVEVCHGGWDTHNGLKGRLTNLCQAVDQPIAALLTDLKKRNLLKDTLVVWGGEFGRTPTAQNKEGRDHNAAGFTMWLAGGGVKGGFRYGATDEYGFQAAADKLHQHDLHATMLHLLGLDHQRLTFRYGGRDYSLTDIHGRVAKEIMA
jgi:hypothetical protein